MTDTTSPNIQLVQDTYAAFGRGDIDAVSAGTPTSTGTKPSTPRGTRLVATMDRPKS